MGISESRNPKGSAPETVSGFGFSEKGPNRDPKHISAFTFNKLRGTIRRFGLVSEGEGDTPSPLGLESPRLGLADRKPPPERLPWAPPSGLRIREEQ